MLRDQEEHGDGVVVKLLPLPLLLDLHVLLNGFSFVIDSGLGGVPREQMMLKGHLPRVIHHQVY